MRTITYEVAEMQEESGSAFLMLLLKYTTEIGVVLDNLLIRSYSTACKAKFEDLPK